MHKTEMPLGFSFALAQNPDAMKTFALLSEPRQHEILERARTVSSKDEMQMLVNGLPDLPL